MSALKTLAAATISAAMMATANAAPVAQTETLKVEVTESQIDEIGGVIYSQIHSRRANRALRMTLLVPRTPEKKPAIVYFPGGGFTSSDYEKFIEMRFALAKAGFVVAAAGKPALPAALLLRSSVRAFSSASIASRSAIPALSSS